MIPHHWWNRAMATECAGGISDEGVFVWNPGFWKPDDVRNGNKLRAEDQIREMTVAEGVPLKAIKNIYLRMTFHFAAITIPTTTLTIRGGSLTIPTMPKPELASEPEVFWGLSYKEPWKSELLAKKAQTKPEGKGEI